MRSRAGSICGGSPPSSASEERRTPSLVRRLTKRRLRARHSPDGFTYASPCSSLFAPFFTRFRGDSGCDNPQKPLCFQSVGQKARSLAEQALNRETIRLIREIILPDKGRNREITGARTVRADWAPFRPNSAARNVAAKPTSSSSHRYDPSGFDQAFLHENSR